MQPRIHVPIGLLILVSVLMACTSGGPEDEALFVDRAAVAGLRFRHENGMSGDLLFVEMMGSGGALLDYDNDGDLDIYLVQGGPLEPPSSGSSPSASSRGDRLFRNDLDPAHPGSADLAFTDVTGLAGIVATAYGMGVATGDIDNNGWVDIYVTNFGRNQLWLNLGLGADGEVHFEEVGAESLVDAPGWSASAAWLDYDRDGWLDLYVTGYVGYELESAIPCRNRMGVRDYCGPLAYKPARDTLFRNMGPDADGRIRFEDATGAAGLGAATQRGLGVLSSDFNGDGWMDIYVANDMTANFMWINQGEDDRGRVTFADEAVISGCAFDRDGRAEASMGLAAADVDSDGDDDLFMTHLRQETNTFYRNEGADAEGRVLFTDATAAAQLASSSLASTGFGTLLFDFDNDGWLDLLAVNGAVTSLEEQAATGDPLPLRQRNQLYRSLGVGEGGDVAFEDVSELAGPVFELAEVSRGAVSGDIDNDGDIDVLITNNHGPARLLVNQVGNRLPWLGLKLVGRETRRDMLGARATVRLQDGRELSGRVRTDGSYCSAGDPRLLFGLGKSGRVSRIEVSWPDGSHEVFASEGVGRYSTLVQGQGTFTIRDGDPPGRS